MKILALCPRFPYPLEKGDKLRMFHLLRYLGKEHEVFLVTLSDHKVSKEHIDILKKHVSKISIFKTSTYSKAKAITTSLASRIPFQVAVYYQSSIKAKIEKIARDFQPDHVYCQLPRMAEYAKGLPFPKTLDYMDAFGVGMIRRADVVSGMKASLYRQEAKRMKAYERDIYAFFDHHTIISGQDAKQIDIPQSGFISIIPNGIDTDYFSPIEMDREYDIGFVGNMGYPPNVDAAEYLIKQIKPKLDNSLKYMLAGARPDKRVKLLSSKNVEVSGWVDDVREAYAKCKIFVAPLWLGTGQQNKILEAMALGIPCVTTSSVNNAIEAEHQEEILVADTLEEFVSAIKLLLEDEKLQMKIKNNARKFVESKYCWHKSASELIKVMNGEFL